MRVAVSLWYAGQTLGCARLLEHAAPAREAGSGIAPWRETAHVV